jgi:HD-GYP domain-containing protein (c-di-GMP phosphodiesterase class II)
LLELLAEAIDCREAFLPGSSSRVREHATRLGKALKLSANDQLTFERAALVRDIGKLKIPNDVLLKDDVLTYDEWQLIHQHAAIGADLVASLDVLKDTEDVVRYHHECFDGTGYPAGLEGDAIPYLARAMKVIDVYCAMTSPRHYRKNQTTHAAAAQHLDNERGKHFDPEIVAAFVASDIGKQ